MPTYALIYESAVQEIIPPAYDEDGNEYPISVRYAADFVDRMVDITNLNPMPEGGWSYLNGVFAPYQAPLPTPAEILTRNTEVRDHYLAVATLAIAPLQDAADLGDATVAETALLKKWKEYRRDTNRVDLTASSPEWPQQPI